jgi:eukaryotic-like serine/threonine-protein kinase
VFKFITHRSFWLNLIVIILLGIGLIFGVLKMLGVITKHGDYLKVPNVVHANTAASIKSLEDKGFTVVIQDSVYTDTLKMGTVIKQFPEGNSLVKVNRVVMLTVNRVTLPLIEVPTFTSKSKEYALEILERSHFVLGDTIFKPSYMLGAVIEQHYNGVEVAPGTKIPWGSKIDLVIASGLSDNLFPVPDFVGMTHAQAKAEIEAKGLLLASTIGGDGESIKDTANSFVIKQIPPRINEDQSPNYIRAGQIVDLWVSTTRRVVIDTTIGVSEEVANKAVAEKEENDKKREEAKEARRKARESEKDNENDKPKPKPKPRPKPSPKPTVKPAA